MPARRKSVRELDDSLLPATSGKGQRAHEPTDDTRATVYRMSCKGIPQSIIQLAIGISLKTLHKYYSAELDKGKVECVESLLTFASARAQQSDSVLIFLLKTVAGLKENEETDRHAGGPRVIEFRVTKQGERIKATASVDDDDI